MGVLFGTSLAIAATSLVSSGRASEPGFPPQFVGTPYVVTADVTTPGPHRFSISGSAFDPDAGDTVTISGSGFTPFTLFTSVPGNPATFTLSGVGFSIDDRGTYVVRLLAQDNSPVQHGTGAGVTIVVAPEPASSSLFAATCFLIGNRRRQR